jgi:hypothetical protein
MLIKIKKASNITNSSIKKKNHFWQKFSLLQMKVNFKEHQRFFKEMNVESPSEKIDFFSAGKMAINGTNWHFSALLQLRALFSLGIDAFSAEKIGATQPRAEKNAKKWLNWHFLVLPQSCARFFTRSTS